MLALHSLKWVRDAMEDDLGKGYVIASVVPDLVPLGEAVRRGDQAAR
jgi:hypothetical protein